MISAYESRAGITPTFPIILYSDGGSELAQLFGMANYGGPTWMCHPKLFFEESGYSESRLTNDANAAINDDCLGTYISLAKNTYNSSDVKIFKNELILYIDKKEEVAINLITLKGQILYSAKENLSEGINRITMNGRNISNGVYILDIKGNADIHYRNKVMLK